MFQPNNSNNLIEIINKAPKIALEGRPGPVLIDLPMNIQRDVFSKNIRKSEKQKKILKIFIIVRK